MISQTMRSLKLPEELQDNVLNYLQYIHETPDFQQDLDKFFALLSPALKNKILGHLHMGVIQKVDIFTQCSSIEIGFIMNNLKVLLFMPGDYIIRQNEDSFQLYFISRGSVEVFIQKLSIDKSYQNKHTIKYRPEDDEEQAKDSTEQAKEGAAKDQGSKEEKKSHSEEGLVCQNYRIASLQEGQYFGEIGLITRLKRTATVKSNDYCTLSSIDKSVLEQTREQYPIIFNKFKEKLAQYSDFDFSFRMKMV
mmetsp:Transcript_18741/g.28766  ORF Transcript_18741/g.28766 Transcript_18741/m.28766 type:complete len:250 (-) Transcript_18741:1147-1896(-)